MIRLVFVGANLFLLITVFIGAICRYNEQRKIGGWHLKINIEPAVTVLLLTRFEKVWCRLEGHPLFDLICLYIN